MEKPISVSITALFLIGFECFSLRVDGVEILLTSSLAFEDDRSQSLALVFV